MLAFLERALRKWGDSSLNLENEGLRAENEGLRAELANLKDAKTTAETLRATILEDAKDKWNTVTELFNALGTLRQAAYDNFQRRGTYEWKMCVTIWTPIVAFIGIIMTSGLQFPLSAIIIVSLCFVVIHGLWQANLGASNAADSSKMYASEDIMRCLAGAPDRESRGGFGVFSGWSHKLYVGITVLLTLVAVSANHIQWRSIVLPSDIAKTISDEEANPIDKYVENVVREHLDSRTTEWRSIVLPGAIAKTILDEAVPLDEYVEDVLRTHLESRKTIGLAE